MIKKTGSRGFTLIELLVVIAIIGILASVVLASLNTARGRGSDAAIKANLSNARAQAELFYETGTTYAGVCAAGTNTIQSLVSGAAIQAGTTAGTINTTAIVSGTTNTICRDAETTWIAASTLRTSNTRMFCVDYTGAAREVGATLDAAATTCPTS